MKKVNWVIEKPKFDKALKSDMTPYSIDRDNKSAQFSGHDAKGRLYTTTLESCTCVSFAKDKRPCKHMYRLAMELGMMKGNFETNRADIPIADALAYTAEKLTDMLESCPVKAQKKLFSAMRHFTSRSKTALKSDVPELREAGLIIFDGEAYVFDAPCRKNAHHLYTYLRRKFADQDFATESGFVTYPAGASLYVENDHLMCSFPDDEITRLLNKHGANRCAEPLILS